MVAYRLHKYILKRKMDWCKIILPFLKISIFSYIFNLYKCSIVIKTIKIFYDLKVTPNYIEEEGEQIKNQFTKNVENLNIFRYIFLFFFSSNFIWLKKIFCGLRPLTFILGRKKGSYRTFMQRMNTISTYLEAHFFFIVFQILSGYKRSFVAWGRINLYWRQERGPIEPFSKKWIKSKNI